MTVENAALFPYNLNERICIALRNSLYDTTGKRC
jgi:hypothetical protein